MSNNLSVNSRVIYDGSTNYQISQINAIEIKEVLNSTHKCNPT